MDKVNQTSKSISNRVQLDKVNLDQQVNRNTSNGQSQSRPASQTQSRPTTGQSQSRPSGQNQGQSKPATPSTATQGTNSQPKATTVLTNNARPGGNSRPGGQNRPGQRFQTRGRTRPQLHLFNHQYQEKKENYQKKLHFMNH